MSSSARAERRISAALLDLDGTLVDSLAPLRSVYRAFLSSRGAHPSDDEFDTWNGPGLPEVVAGLQAAHQLTGPLDALTREYRRRVEAAYLAEAQLAVGATELLDWVEASGLVAAVVTSSPEALARPLLARLSVLGRLAALVCGDQVARGKPAPDLYHEALHRLGVEPRQALAFEDSPAGVAAATAAQVRVIGISARPRALLSAGARTVVPDLRQAREVLAALACGPGRIIPARRFAVLATAEPLQLDADTEHRIEAVWRAAQASRPSLTDGKILSAVSFRIDAGELEVRAHSIHYRHFLAERAGVTLGARPLGVTATTLVGSGDSARLVFGRRSSSVTQYPGSWELVPSGGVPASRLGAGGRVDVEAQLLEELEEELGVAAAGVRVVAPLGLVEDLGDGVLDLAYRLELAVDPGALETARRNAEYTRLELVPRDSISDFLRGAGEALAPTVLPLLELLGWTV